ncbi:tetratricopeptide repeat protein [Actinoplanes sp. NPDC026619]|uniref:tetratricopeptide repeat protein n=1 Tax=Actinoplanes sp. NPDC026619 TaxID=3155798 RepID=UPI003407AE65
MDAFGTLPDPSRAAGLHDLVERLRLLKVWAGDPSYETIKERVNAAWAAAGRPPSELARRSTVANCFKPDRRRLNTDLVLAVVQALHPDTGYVTGWRQALRVVAGETEAVSQVRVHDKLPQEPAGFTGRAGDLRRLRAATRAGDTVVISALEGMAGVGKTQLAIHAGHLLSREGAVDRVLFVNLRGFHPDPAQPPADPAAVLDGFLRLLGLPGHQVPHDLPRRIAAYRERLAGTRTLVVLDDAASSEQVRPLLPATPGCLALITSRRSLVGLYSATRLSVDVFTPAEAAAFLTAALPGVPAGTDPDAAARIALRCGYLPLALSVLAGHIRKTPGWTLTDHADRLDERHHDGRLDGPVELALGLSYQRLTPARQHLLRLAALHPGQDFDVYAAAALAGADLPATEAGLRDLHADHLLLAVTEGRYTFHDLVRAYATALSRDRDRPADRHAALTRLFDHYLATSAAAMNTLHPTEARRRPAVSPAATEGPDLSDPDTAVAWLDAERPTLVAVAAHGSRTHTVRLADVLSRYLRGGHYTDALIMHGHARDAARSTGDLAGQAGALNGLGVAHLRQGRPETAAVYLAQALDLFDQVGDLVGQGHTLFDLGNVAERSGRYPAAIDYKRQSLERHREAGDRTGEAMALSGLGVTLERAGHLSEALDCYQQALTLVRQTGDRRGEAYSLNGLGELELRLGRYESATGHLLQALTTYRQLGSRTGEASTLDGLGLLHTRLGRLDEATGYYERALAIFRETGNQDNEAWVLNGLGEAAQAAGRAADAVTHHTAAATIATGIGNRRQQARAHAGLGHAHRALGHPDQARDHFEQALSHYTALDLPEADQIRTDLSDLG